MTNITFIIVILAVASYPVFAGDVSMILGEMTPIAMFPMISRVPGNCVKYNITRAAGSCSCGDVTGLPLLAMVLPGAFNQEFVPIIANNVAEVPAKLQYKDCTCGEEDAIRLVFMEVNDNYIIQYEAPLGKYADNEENTAILIAKKTLPTRAELDSFIKTLPDLRNRKYGLLCQVY